MATPEIRALEHHLYAKSSIIGIFWRNQCSGGGGCWLPGSSRLGENIPTLREPQTWFQVTSRGQSQAVDSKGRVRYQKRLIYHKALLKDRYILLQFVAFLLYLLCPNSLLQFLTPLALGTQLALYHWDLEAKIAPVGTTLCNTAWNYLEQEADP